MLIVNADDVGRNVGATDRALECYTRHRITSGSAMVFMRDSERAASLAQASGMDIGLHINFSEPFSANGLSPRVRDCHDRVCSFLRANKYALLVYRPDLCGAFQSVMAAQYAEYVRLYGREPSHIDGHQHMHLATNVLAQRLLPRGAKVRRSFSFHRGEKSFVNRAYRSAIDHWVSRRHVTTDYFFALSQRLTCEEISSIVELAVTADVELMTHPANDSEYEFLMSDEYAAVIARVDCGGYANLS